MLKLIVKYGWVVILAINSATSAGQDLEPRALTTIPDKTNFLAVGYDYSYGNLLLDPAIPIEDLNANTNIGLLAYVRSFGFLGNSSKINLLIPYVQADFQGMLNGVDSSRSIHGFGDPIIRFSTNFMGSPNLDKEDYSEYVQGTVIGFSLKVRIPLGIYDNTRTLNIGSNRFTIKPEVGISTRLNNWIFESYLAAWLFTANDDFWALNQTVVMKQKPLLAFKQHFIYTFSNRTWLATSIGYGFGGQTQNNEVELDNRMSTIRWGATFALPINRSHTLKFAYNNSVALERGPDFESFTLLYQFRWINE